MIKIREYVDLFLSRDGDIVIENKDLKTSSFDTYLEQSAINRIKSIKGNWFKDNIGADMEEILGEPNTRTVAEMGKNKIITSLTEDNMFELDEVFVKVVPTSRNNVMYFVALKGYNGPIFLNFNLDLVNGINLI